jgi:hypothetical protein
LILLVAALCVSPSLSDETAASSDVTIDPRLEKFLDSVYEDKALLKKEKQIYAENKVSFEQFIFSIWSGAVKMDDTPDNSQALASLGGYLEKNRPPLSPDLLKHMEKFISVKSNNTFMRGMFLETVRGLIVSKK